MVDKVPIGAHELQKQEKKIETEQYLSPIKVVSLCVLNTYADVTSIMVKYNKKANNSQNDKLS